MTTEDQVQLAVALDGAGWHPAAWREADARPRALVTPEYWVDLVRRAESGLLDFVTVHDSLATLPLRRGVPDRSVGNVRGRLDAVLIAARVAPVTRSVGLVPAITTTHTEPFHIAKSVATLDFVSSGRAGLQARVSPTPEEALLFGRRELPRAGPADPAAGDPPGYVTDLFDEAAEYVEVVRRLWDSWEDDAEIRDVATGRFIDRDKLHPIGFEGRFFCVRGPSITPRPPQGQPPVAVLAHVPVAFDLAARSADVVFVTPRDTDDVRGLVATVRAHEEAVRREGAPLRVFADVVTFLDDDAGSARGRLDRLDARSGRAFRSDALAFVGTPSGLADLAGEWRAAGVDGLRLRPGTLPHDLDQITGPLVDELRRRSRFRSRYAEHTLRERLGLARPTNRYAAA
jgi:alkanesulfonate monooxygenase SsuD/methylene tetrahydromethanopterin reductase-like flavin-dependent oxidoreductase (luciferase family)